MLYRLKEKSSLIWEPRVDMRKRPIQTWMREVLVG